MELSSRCLFEFLGNHSIFCSLNIGTVTVRYNVVPTGALYLTPANGAGVAAFSLSTRLRDTGNGQRVLLRLQEVNLQSGNETTLLTVDSDSLNPTGTAYQTSRPSPCAFTFNFDVNAYYLEARISNDNSSGVSPGLESISIQRCGTL